MQMTKEQKDKMLEERGIVVYDRVTPEVKKYKTVSLFSGIGGFDLGFMYAGFDVIWANDFEKNACETYKANVADHIHCGDIRVEKENIPEHEVLIGGFPCQPFSTLGKLQGFDDEAGRGTLFFQIADIIQKHNTKVVVLENVKNIMNHNNGETFKKILSELDELGYKCYYHIFNSQNYGVPQRRNRCYIVALKKDYFKDLPETNDLFPFPAKEYEDKDQRLNTLKMLDQEVEAKYFLTKKIKPTIMGRGTKNYIVNPTIDLPISKTLTATMHKMHRASQDNYVTDQKHYDMINDITEKDKRDPLRKLTPNECRQLQGFPPDWHQVVSDCQAYKQFGNAVTVNVSYALADVLFSFIKEHKTDNWGD